MARTTKKLLTTAILGAHMPLRLFVVFGMVLSMFSALVPGASAASVTGATFTAGGVLVNGTHFAKSGANLMLTVTTDNTTQCVELTGAHKTALKSDTNRTDWAFELTANPGEGVQTVTATAYRKPHPNQSHCIAEGGETFGVFSASYTLDNTGPLVTGTLVPKANGAGWNKSDVAITWTATDPVGIDTITPASDSVSTNTTTAGVTKTAIAKDKLGNSTTGSVTVKLDKDAPTITGTRSPAANAAGWNNSDVTAGFTTGDALSGVATTPASKTFGEGANQSHTGTVTDNAGNSASATVGDINVDKTKPTLSGAPTTDPNGAGWYNSAVTIRWAASDALSGLAGSAPVDSTISGEGEGLTASASVADKAGNTTTATSSPAVKIDTAAPNTTATAPANWNNVDVTVSLSANDTLAGVKSTHYTLNGGAQQTGTSVAISAEGIHTLAYWSVDNAGNVEAAKTIQVKIDKTTPTINHTQAPAANGNGWNNTDVVVTFVCADPQAANGSTGSGIASCTASQTVTTEGTNQAVTGTATDNAGNSATDPATVSIDKKAPSISATVDRTANGAGWYNADVTVSFTCGDALSGIATCPASKTLGEGADQSARGTATDAAGNSASAEVKGINVDKTAPTLTGTPSTTGWSRDDVTVTWAASDALSGLVGRVPPPSTVTGEGDNLSASASVSDKAGHTTSETVSGIKIDRNAPSTSVSVPKPLPTGWYAGAVEVTLTGVDALSGVAKTYYSVDGGAAQEYTRAFTHSLKGEHTITFWSVDVAGNVEDQTASGHAITLKLDGTPPTTTISLPKAFTDGWYADKVPVAFAAVDAESGVATTYYSVDGGAEQEYDGTFEHTLDGTHTITFWSVDGAGNVEDKTKAANTVEIKVDTTNPTITSSRTPAANGFGWNNTDVTVSFKCTDSQSGVAIENCTPDTPVTNEGAGQSVSGIAKDNVGKTAGTTVDDINIDKTKPTITASAKTADDKAYTAGSWTNQDVTVSFTCSDALSGIATCPASVTLSGNGAGQEVAGTAEDKAGNTNSATVSGINIDKTAPKLTLPENPTVPATSSSGAAVSYTASASDDLDSAPVVACSPASGSTFPVGTTTVTCSATDRAGNTASGSFPVTVTDTTAPVISKLPANMAPTATSAAGAVANWTAPSATDNLDGPVPVTCASATGLTSGNTFPLGTTTVTCTATDKAGNTASGSFTVTVTYSWSGLLQPVNSDGSSIFKLGSTVPVKFKLTNGSAGITNATAKVYYAKVSNGVAGSELEGTSIAAADSGNTFRYDATNDQYIFNLGTKGLSEGTYQLRIDLGDGVLRTVNISLKK